jgi:hypothetical protein
MLDPTIDNTNTTVPNICNDLEKYATYTIKTCTPYITTCVSNTIYYIKRAYNKNIQPYIHQYSSIPRKSNTRIDTTYPHCGLDQSLP